MAAIAHLAAAFVITAVWLPETSDAATRSSAKPILTFQGGADGSRPSGSMVLDAAGVLGAHGALYGTTQFGGDIAACTSTLPEFSGCGTVYRLLPPTPARKSWKHEVLHRFTVTGPPHDLTNSGLRPISGLVLDPRRRALYGSAEGGNSDSAAIGAIFELRPPRLRVNRGATSCSIPSGVAPMTAAARSAS